MQQHVTTGIAAALIIALGGSALAQQPSQAQANAIRQACRADYQAHCADVPTGGSASLACLQQNAASLSPGCQHALSAISKGNTSAANPPAAATQAHQPPPMSPREEVQLMRSACGADYRAYCNGVRPGGGRAVACLEEHGPSLSRQCRSALIAARQSR
jgi:hypothetical protein